MSEIVAYGTAAGSQPWHDRRSGGARAVRGDCLIWLLFRSGGYKRRSR